LNVFNVRSLDVFVDRGRLQNFHQMFDIDVNVCGGNVFVDAG
jgi:hypothetical protein